MRKLIAVIVIVVLIVVIIPVITIISYYNRFVTMEETAKNQWAQVESQLKRRFDLIPNLVETAKGYMTHEREVFTNIAEARAKLAGATTLKDKIEGERGLGMVLGRLLALVENYPQLKANENFLKLMDQLEGTENRIAVERMRYNESVRAYNTLIKRFPGNILARWFGREALPYFKTVEEEETVPEVRF
ncbi:LemA family protein [candidate division WOR-3 bacterium JGI_Cruoil_03_44_89]|uniref:LemA family protein n=1 Tax=candidate division WOR-3 bacterium JGI_Cruoil_03_44_89 TaxID=1973748 RepID=A0A235BSA4_UNCW3|nr:MAG: LemA family protein [candidate division WOR-3 bacterium JGI_Cruoil_03_44_89]OYD14445.1 MAG: LemA family protein [candidate division WOR-3 bacterium JGI_Cruoil_03_44_89]